MPVLSLPDGLLLGAASAATQIEGRKGDNSWYDWYRRGHITDGSDPARATGHYELYREDAELMRKMGIRDYRFGVEWARLEPEDGVFDEKEFKHYEDELIYLRALGIRPLLTLHHFTNPMWFEKIGAFENDRAVEIFIRFTRKVVERLGNYVNEYVTINEPNVYAVNGFFFGSWPPGAKSMKRTFRVMNSMCRCHVAAYKLIHAMYGKRPVNVGFALHMRVFEPKNKNSLIHGYFAKKIDSLFQTDTAYAFATGKMRGKMKGTGDEGMFADFFGLNYYTRSSISGFSDGVRDGAPVNDLGWEIYPEGIAITAKKLLDIADLPIYITENGTCDNDDSFRARYIFEHLKALIDVDIPVSRYYHWCFTDNFEWLEGNSARFGLVKIDYDTLERSVKKSGEFYSELIAKRAVDEEMYQKYCDTPYKTNGGR